NTRKPTNIFLDIGVPFKSMGVISYESLRNRLFENKIWVQQSGTLYTSYQEDCIGSSAVRLGMPTSFGRGQGSAINSKEYACVFLRLTLYFVRNFQFISCSANEAGE